MKDFANRWNIAKLSLLCYSLIILCLFSCSYDCVEIESLIYKTPTGKLVINEEDIFPIYSNKDFLFDEAKKKIYIWDDSYQDKIVLIELINGQLGKKYIFDFKVKGYSVYVHNDKIGFFIGDYKIIDGVNVGGGNYTFVILDINTGSIINRIEMGELKFYRYFCFDEDNVYFSGFQSYWSVSQNKFVRYSEDTSLRFLDPRPCVSENKVLLLDRETHFIYIYDLDTKKLVNTEIKGMANLSGQMIYNYIDGKLLYSKFPRSVIAYLAEFGPSGTPHAFEWYVYDFETNKTSKIKINDLHPIIMDIKFK